MIRDKKILMANRNHLNRYQIRSMFDDDIAKVVEIERATWKDDSWSPEEFFRGLDNPYYNCWIVESIDNNNYLIVGYGLQYLLGYVSHIANLCIEYNHRGRGLGEELLQHMIDYARKLDATSVELEVNTTNVHAYRLYHKHGFIIRQFLERYYSNTADAYRMQLIIKENVLKHFPTVR